MKVLDLFSGIGGFSLGLERAGMETVAFCEIDPFCQKVLKKHWPDVPIHTDITKLDGKQYAGAIDLVCGGFPCQPFSVAGKQKGKIDIRHLWPEMFRVVKESKPTWFIGENVPGIINMELEHVCADLEAEGYEVQTLIIPACGVNAPHRRNRVWVIAHSQHNGQPTPKKQRNDAKTICRSEERQKSAKQPKGVDTSSFVADTKSGWQQGKQPVRSKTWRFSSGSWWATEPSMGRVVNGVPGRVDRLRGLGNAVVPQIVEIIGKGIIENEK